MHGWQQQQVLEQLPFITAERVGPGRWVLDPGFEIQGGFQLRVIPKKFSKKAPNGVVATVQLADERLVNGSAMWQTRAGMRYQVGIGSYEHYACILQYCNIDTY